MHFIIFFGHMPKVMCQKWHCIYELAWSLQPLAYRMALYSCCLVAKQCLKYEGGTCLNQVVE